MMPKVTELMMMISMIPMPMSVVLGASEEQTPRAERLLQRSG
jgi:hypothetical protein